MAVQAQYPSNVLLLNRIVLEEKNPQRNDYSLQPRPDGSGGFLDQTQMMFTNGVGTNQRKRGRTTTSAVNPFSLQTHQLHTPPPPNVVSTGLRLAFGEQQQQQLRQQQQLTLSPQQTLSPESCILLDDLGPQIKQQRDEIEQFLQAQGEHVRRTLAEKRQRHYHVLLSGAEESVARRLREKEAEVEKAARRNAELEARAAQLSAEARAWQSRARAQEATAATLQVQLQQAIIGGAGGGDRGLELGCGGEAEDAESAYVDPDRVEAASGPSCRNCRKRVASVVLLPCRHLCLCTECGPLAQACPLCLTFRGSSVEVLFS